MTEKTLEDRLMQTNIQVCKERDDLVKKVVELKKDKAYLQGVIKNMLRTERKVDESNRISQWVGF